MADEAVSASVVAFASEGWVSCTWEGSDVPVSTSSTLASISDVLETIDLSVTTDPGMTASVVMSVSCRAGLWICPTAA